MCRVERQSGIDERISALLDMASALTTPAPVLRKVDKQERERMKMAASEKHYKAAQALANVTDAKVRKMLGRMAQEMQPYDRDELRDVLNSILQRVELRSGSQCPEALLSNPAA